MNYSDLYADYQGFLDSLPDAHTLYGLDFNEIWSNRVVALMRSRAEGESLRQNCALCDTLLSCSQCHFQEAPDTVQEGERVLKGEDGRSWRIRVIPLRNDSGEVANYLKISTDITSEISFQEEASKSRYLASLGELSAGVAHEINNPNGLVLMNLALLKDVFRDLLPHLDQLKAVDGGIHLGGLPLSRVKVEAPQVINEMIDGSRRIKRIVEELKDFARGAHDDFSETVDVRLMLEKAVRMVQFIIEKYSNAFEMNIDEKLPLISGNAQRLEQVAINLILNACQALSDKNQSITLSAYLDDSGKSLIISVADEGRGIDKEHISQLTDPFFTTRRNTGGTGLGLSVSARIVREHEGELLFESSPKQGTVATIRLPIE